MSDAAYYELFPLGADDAPYRKLTGDHVSIGTFEGCRIVKVAPEGLTLLAAQAFADSAHLLRPGHLAQLRAILNDPDARDISEITLSYTFYKVDRRAAAR